MALTNPQIIQCRRDFVAGLKELLADVPCKFTKAEIDAVFAAVDQWCTDNQASFNTTLPVGFRTNASATEKAVVLGAVALRRAGR